MILIAHRGNISGPSPEKENNPRYIDFAIEAGYNVEVDIRGSLDSELYLGHNMPQYKITPDWLFERAQYLWIHAKDTMSLHSLITHSDMLNVFWHQHDDYTLTKNGYIWAYPGMKLSPGCICVLPELNTRKHDIKLFREFDISGICTDYPNKF